MTQTVAAFALLAAGLVIFVPSALFLAASQRAQLSDWLAWLIPFAIWTSALLPQFRLVRAPIQIGAGFVLVLMTFVVPDGPAWIPVGIVTFAVIVAAVFNLSTWSTFAVIILAALVDFLAVQSSAASIGLFGVSLIAPWAGALLNLVAGGGLLIAWTAWMRNVRRADAEFIDIQLAVDAEERASAAQAGVAAVARRIHETILNTLAGISMGLPATAQDQAQRTCQRDLDQLNRGLDQLGAVSLSEVVASAKRALEPTALQCALNMSDDVSVEAVVANALRDAIVESLRNVERHSGVLKARIDITVTDEIVTTITDNGVGPGVTAQERFGTRNAIRANLRAIGGTATLAAAVSGGTEVTLHVPRSQERSLRVPSFPILGIADSTLLGRLGATGTNLFMVGITPIIIREFGAPQLTALTIVAYVACMFALAITWTTKARTPLIWLGVILLPLPFVVAGSDALTCVAAPGVQGLITGMASGGVLLLLIAATQTWLRIAIVLIALGGSAWLSRQLPSTCEQEALLSTGVNTIYMVAIVIVITWIDLGFESRRTAAVDAWERLLDERMDRERRKAEEASWAAVPQSTRELLGQIASGIAPVTDPSIQARAAREASLLRTQLGLAAATSTTLDHLLTALAPTATTMNITLEAEPLMALQRTDPLPADLLSYLDRLIRTTSDSTVTVRTIVDDGWEEIVLVLPAPGSQEQPPPLAEDVITESEIDDDGFAHVSVRRPSTSTSGSIQ